MSTRRNFTRGQLRLALIDRIRTRYGLGKVINPLPGCPVTFEYGIADPGYAAGYHTGEDHSTHGEVGKRCIAVSPGVVVEATTTGGTWGSAYGTILVIQTLDGRYRYAYCHLSRILVTVSQHVTVGQTIALSGDTGNSSGPHLHFEARKPPFHYGDDVCPRRVKRKAL